MKRSRLIVLGLLGLVLAIGLSGCKITSATPYPGKPIVMKPGDTLTFKVAGPPILQIVPGYKYDYIWTSTGPEIDERGNYYEHELLYSKDTFVYTADPQKTPFLNRMKIACSLYKCHQYETTGGFFWAYELVDRREWNVTIVQDPPTWQGAYHIRDTADLEVLRKYTAVTGDLIIAGSSFTDLTGIPVGLSVGGSLRIFTNNAMTSLAGFENLTSVGGELSIYDNNALTSLSGLENIISAGALAICFNHSLTSLSGLENITSADALYIRYNDALRSLSALNNLTSIGGNLYIDSNAILTSLSGLNNLTSIGGTLYIDSNTILTSLSGLENITLVGRDLWITSNNALTSLGMVALQRIERYLSISGNVFLCNSLAEELRDQVLAGGGIGVGSNITGNKDCTTP